jgi:hypothetical protein
VRHLFRPLRCLVCMSDGINPGLHLLSDMDGDRRSAYAGRVSSALDLQHCRVVQSMEQDGLYLYKRPVVGTGGAANILSQAGSIFHHILLLVKHDEVRTAAAPTHLEIPRNC